MKKLFITLMVAVFATSLSAQSDYFIPEKGTTLKYSVSVTSAMGAQKMYAKMFQKDAEAGKAAVVTEMYMDDTFKNPVQTQNIIYTVTPENYTISVKDLMAGNLGQVENLEILESSGEMIYPKEVVIGKEYPGATIKLKGNVQGMNLTFNIELDALKAEAKEQVEVPAGKFDCIKFTQNSSVEVMGQEQTMENTSWYAPGVGLVKQVVDMMGGMATSTMELISK